MTEGDDDDGDDLPLTEATVFVVLGAGFVGMIADVSWFWAIWVVGFAAVLPLVGIFEQQLTSRLSGSEDRTPEQDALEELKERYAHGEIGDREFERRLERLVENETVDDVEARLGDGYRAGTRDDPSSTTDTDREPEFER